MDTYECHDASKYSIYTFLKGIELLIKMRPTQDPVVPPTLPAFPKSCDDYMMFIFVNSLKARRQTKI